jgi:hypothetical protein
MRLGSLARSFGIFLQPKGARVPGEPAAAPAMIGRLPGVTAVQNAGAVSNVDAYRTPLIPGVDTNGLTVDAARLDLPAASGTSIAARMSPTEALWSR